MWRLLRLWRLARADLGLLLYALRHPSRPVWLWPAALLLVLYAIDPFNFLVPLLGIVDDVILLPIILHLTLSLLPGEIRAGYLRRAALNY
jgi:uncharacterized membrane protein YkvA (DUF1232 family)